MKCDFPDRRRHFEHIFLSIAAVSLFIAPAGRAAQLAGDPAAASQLRVSVIDQDHGQTKDDGGKPKVTRTFISF